MPLVLSALGAFVVFGFFLAGKTVGLLVLPGVVVTGWLTRSSVGYLFAWTGIVLSCATNVKFGPLAASDLFLAPAIVLAIGWLVAQPAATRPRVPAVLLMFGIGLMLLTGIERLADGISNSSVVYALRLSLIVMFMPVMFMVHGRTTRRFDGLLGAYVLSAAANGILAELDQLGLHYASALTGDTGYLHSSRYAGLSTHTTQLGMISVLATPALVYLARKNRAWYLAAPPTIVGILASGSRGALIGMPIALMMLALCERRHRVRMIVTIGALSIAVLLVANAVGLGVGISRLLGNQSGTNSDNGRIFRAVTSLAQIEAKPIFGHGLGNPYAHDAYLELIRAGGLVLAVPMYAVWLWAFVAALRTRHPIAVVSAAMMGTYLIMNAQFNGIYERYLWVPFSAAASMAAMLYYNAFDREGDDEVGQDTIDSLDARQPIATAASTRNGRAVVTTAKSRHSAVPVAMSGARPAGRPQRVAGVYGTG